MTKTTSLRRLLLPCFTIPTTPITAATTNTTTTTTKKRLSTSLRDNTDNNPTTATSPSSSDTDSVSSRTSLAPPRASKSMVICTFFGARRSHVFFCVQLNRLSSTKPLLLLELSLTTHSLIKEMRSGLVRIALECDRALGPVPLHSVPLWTLYCNGRRLGSAARRKPGDDTQVLLKKMENTTVGAGVIPSGPGSGSGQEEVMYMRANYEWVVGGADSESFHLVSPDDCPGQELSLFLLRSR